MQCYGDEGIFYECAMNLLSLSRLYKKEELEQVEIWIYTDKPAWFNRFRQCDLPLNFKPLNDIILKQWRGKIDFVHRVKIEMLKNVLQGKDGSILYVDTDTLFTRRIDELWQQIEGGALFMHMDEGKVSGEGNEVLRKLNAFLHSSQAPQGKPLYDMQMWNAGVLGFNTGHAALLDEVLKLTDSVYARYPKHIAEQFAFSVIFQQQGKVQAAEPYLFHYWNLKEGRELFAKFFKHFEKATWAELTHYSKMIDIPGLVKEKVNFKDNRGFMGKLMGRQWEMKRHDWHALMKQLR